MAEEAPSDGGNRSRRGRDEREDAYRGDGRDQESVEDRESRRGQGQDHGRVLRGAEEADIRGDPDQGPAWSGRAADVPEGGPLTEVFLGKEW